MIRPSALNLVITGAMVVIFVVFWRMAAAKLSVMGSPFGDAMGSIL